jgi:hypothetical protein
MWPPKAYKNDIELNVLPHNGMYHLTCLDCNKQYVGQTGWSFRTRYREQLRDFKYNSGNSKYAQHLIEILHSIGLINESMTVLHTINKSKMMNTLEKFHIYNVIKTSIQNNERNTVTQNILFDVVLQLTTYRGQHINQV